MPRVSQIRNIYPRIQQSKSGESMAVLIIRFGSWFPRPIHGDFDRLRIGGDLEGYRADLYRQRKRLSSSATTNESQIIELGDLVFHDSRAISQFTAAILIVASSDSD